MDASREPKIDKKIGFCFFSFCIFFVSLHPFKSIRVHFQFVLLYILSRVSSTLRFFHIRVSNFPNGLNTCLLIVDFMPLRFGDGFKNKLIQPKVYQDLCFFFFSLNRVIQSIGWVRIDVIIILLIPKQTRIVQLMNFGLVILLGSFIRVIGNWITLAIWRSKHSIGFFAKHIYFIQLL